MRELVKAFEPDHFKDKFEWPFIFPLALKAAGPYFFCSHSDQSVSTVSPVRSWMCDVGRWNSDLMFIVRLDPKLNPPTPAHLHSKPLYGASCCCCPFLSSCWILIITLKGKRLQSPFIKCAHWEEAKLQCNIHPKCWASSLHLEEQKPNHKDKKGKIFFLSYFNNIFQYICFILKKYVDKLVTCIFDTSLIDWKLHLPLTFGLN